MTRKIIFEPEKYYHIYNRGTDKRKIFMDKGDLYYFFDTIQISNMNEPIKNIDRGLGRKKLKERIKNYYNSNSLVDIVAYALLPNHYHFILKEKTEGGVSKFMQKLANSYTKYFNEKHKRSGVLFQGKFKANEITGDFSVPLTSVYVNLNYKHHQYNLKKDLIKTSIFEYLDIEKGENICNKQEIKNILEVIGGIDSYKKYLKNQSEYFIEKKGHNIF